MKDFIENIVSLIRVASITDLIDILIVAFLLYKLMSLLKDTSAERLIKGIIVILVVMQVMKSVHLNTIGFILDKTSTFGAFALIVIFQPELRRMLEQVGKGRVFRGLISSKEAMTDLESALVQITAACESMSWSRTGALIVVERMEKLGEIVKTGTYVDAETSAELVKNVFYPKSPLHDGAMVIRHGRVLAAGCVLPLSGNQSLSRDLGTRHRAAVGMSEMSDAVLVVVSEETGSISVAIGGMLKRHLAPETLEKVLRAELMPEIKPEKNKTPMAALRRWRGRAK